MLLNRVAEFEREICLILAQLAFHIHPKIVRLIQSTNVDEKVYFANLFGERIPVESYLYEGSACVFPGVKRYVSGKGKKRAYNPEYFAILDDNTFPRHLWCFLGNGRAYSGPNWKNLRLSDFELAHIFTHKESELHLERSYFDETQDDLLPYGDFSCACNITLLPKGTVRPTDNSTIVKAIFYKRYIDLYGENPLAGRIGFKSELVPDWYDDLNWNEPVLPVNWERNTEALLQYRTSRITHILQSEI